MAYALSPRRNAPPAVAAPTNVRAPEPARSFVRFLKAVQDRDEATLEKVYQTGYTSWSSTVTKAALSETSGAAGGYTVPLDYTARLLEVLSEECFIFPRANVIPMAANQLLCPKIDVETVQSAGTSGLFGGVKFTWGFEQAPPETAEPTFRQLSLNAWDLLGRAVVSNQFLADIGPVGEDYLINLFGKAAAWATEYAFLQGTGADQQMPLGVVKAVGMGSLAVTRQTTSTVTIQDITSMTAALLPQSWGRAIWAVHPKALTPIQQLAQYFINIELGGLHKKAHQAAGVLSTLPLFVTDKLPAPGVNVDGDLVLFDPYLYVVGVRQEVLIDASPHPSFRTNQTEFRVWLRLDGKPENSNVITLVDGTTQVSPFVVLKGK